MTNFKTLAAVALLSVSALGFSQDKPEIKIVDVLGGGSGCPVDANGKPSDWNVTFSNVTKALVVDFSSFLVDPDTDTSTCDLRLWLAVPQGKTILAYNSQFTGTADMGDEDYGIFAARLKINGEEFAPVTHTITSGTQDDWETELAKAPAKIQAPCGGELIKVEYNIGLSLFGDDSEIQVSSQSGKFDGIKIELKDCN